MEIGLRFRFATRAGPGDNATAAAAADGRRRRGQRQFCIVQWPATLRVLFRALVRSQCRRMVGGD